MADIIQSVDQNVKRGFDDRADGSFAPIVVAVADQVTALTASIPNGQSITANLDLGTSRLVRISTPAAWTAANLTFQVSADGATWVNLYDASGNEYTVTAAASRGIIIPLSDFLGVRYIAIRSGTSAVPVPQGAQRDLVLTLTQ